MGGGRARLLLNTGDNEDNLPASPRFPLYMEYSEGHLGRERVAVHGNSY